MPDPGRPHDVRGLTASELERTQRELRASLALARPGSPARVPILAQLSAIDTELAERADAAMGQVVTLTQGQLARISQLSDQWSFLWDKRRSVWIAAEDCPDGEQIEEADLDVLLARLPDGRRPAVFSAHPVLSEASPSLSRMLPRGNPPVTGGSGRGAGGRP